MNLESLIVPAYVAALAPLAVYGVHRVWLLARFRWERASSGIAPAPTSTMSIMDGTRPPLVTVQLPIYNERTVAARLIRAAGALDYPRESLEIQVLDDSTDETRAIIDAETAHLRSQGIDARVLRRTGRHGFKSGALDLGQKTARGELVCVFDADFMPEPDFLRRLVPCFADPRVGMVQARWGHSNRDESLLTRAESTLLDGHFVIEHKVRFDSGLFFNFNGTAGIWRRAAIEEAGGWQQDTLTEDLDLSYRAQLDGWKFVYASDVVVPAEVPADIAAFKSQQQRWAKGSVQVLKKIGWRILTSKQPLEVKLEAMAHLTSNVGHPCVLLLSLLLPLTFEVKYAFAAWADLALFSVCTLGVIAFYERSQRALGRSPAERCVDTLAAIALGIGLCVSQSRAVVEGLASGTGEFVRTPKAGGAPRSMRYVSRANALAGVELVVAAWLLWGILSASTRAMWVALPFLVLFCASFAWVGTLSLVELVRTRPRVPEQPGLEATTNA